MISFVANDVQPPLPFEPEKFDLVYALSVFTHIDRFWANWLLELHRVLAPNGLLVATIMSEGMCELVSGEPWDESLVGMNVYESGQPWELGGPMVLHSPWWIREHWGRLFDVLEVRTRGFSVNAGQRAQDDQGVAVLQKSSRSVSMTVEDLERPNPSEPKELSALNHDVLHIRAEMAGLRAMWDASREVRPDTAQA
jgi:SAM-dependent methyltransferase